MTKNILPIGQDWIPLNLKRELRTFFDPEIKSELAENGAQGFIQKPYKPENILKNIRDIFAVTKSEVRKEFS